MEGRKAIYRYSQESAKNERFENYFVEREREKVSVLIPCRNEVQNIEECLNHIFNFDPPSGGFEIIVIDGMSNDGTREVLLRLKEKYPQMILIDNQKGTVSYGMNLGIQRAKGEYIVRTDVRCIHPKSYLRDLIELSERTKADNVGGVLVPMSGDTYVQKSIALAYKSRIAMGGALRDRGDFFGETDTVYGGCFKRQRLLEIGMYDGEMMRNQDDELSFRLRERGGRIIQDGRIKVQYWPRRFYWQLFKQFMQYGYWKVMVIKKHPQQASLRHFLPAALVLGFMTLGMIALFNAQALMGIGIYSMSYFLAIGLESLRSAYRSSLALWPGMVFAIFLIHISFGIGFIIAIVGWFLQLKLRWFESLSR